MAAPRYAPPADPSLLAAAEVVGAVGADPADDVVSGDILLLSEGDAISADGACCRLLRCRWPRPR
jgi:hypothetical protein